MHEQRSETATKHSRLAGFPGEVGRGAGVVTPAETSGSESSRVVAHSLNLILLESRARRVPRRNRRRGIQPAARGGVTLLSDRLSTRNTPLSARRIGESLPSALLGGFLGVSTGVLRGGAGVTMDVQ